jgi:3,4-dihydroxy 2-butanone 4-phosphate synthase/GTP cyclohydrolase II
VICEIMNDDGTMARMQDLMAFAQRHNVKVAAIADLISYRLQHDKIIKRSLETEINSRYGGRFKMYVYVNTVEYAEHIVLVKGDVAGEEPVLVRVHDFNPLDDVLGDLASGREGKLQAAMHDIAEAGKGVLIVIREPRQTRVSELIKTRLAGDEHAGLRDYGVGAQILLDLGVRNMVLLHNTKWTIVGLEGYGLKVVGQQEVHQTEWGLG